MAPSIIFSNYSDELSMQSVGSQSIGDAITMGTGSLGVSHGTPTAAAQPFPVRIRGPALNLVKSTLVAISEGDVIFYDTVNSNYTNTPTGYRMGIAMQAQLITDTVVNVQLEPFGYSGIVAMLQTPVVIGGAAFSSEAVVATLNLPANLPLNTPIRFKAKFRSTGQNSTDTLLLRIRITSLTGTIMAAMTATQMAATTVATLDFEGIISVIGATGAIEGAGATSAVAAAINSAYAVHATSVALNAALPVVVTAIYSSSSATNAGILTDFRLLRDS
jgi:hypothetical protein